MTKAKTGFLAGFVSLLYLLFVAGVLAQPAEAQQAPVADLSIQKFDLPSERVAVGETLFYELAIANLGPGPAAAAVVTDTLPPNTEFLFTFSGDCTNVGNTVTCDLGDLAPGAQAVVEFAVCPTAPGTATNTATVRSSTPDPDPTNDGATESTEVTTPAIGSCPSQQSPRTPRETPPDDPRPDPDPRPGSQPEPAPDPPQVRETANGDLCGPGALAINTRDFSFACAGGLAVAAEGDVPGGNLTGDSLAGVDPVVDLAAGRAVARSSNLLAVADPGGGLDLKP
ncbi:MAG: DUF11 domain-containing protein [Rubrobacteraceae bacterium]